MALVLSARPDTVQCPVKSACMFFDLLQGPRERLFVLSRCDGLWDNCLRADALPNELIELSRALFDFQEQRANLPALENEFEPFLEKMVRTCWLRRGPDL